MTDYKDLAIQELTPEQEDYILECGMEDYYEKKQKCQFCNKGKGEISITDSETLQEVMICEDCEKEIIWN